KMQDTTKTLDILGGVRTEDVEEIKEEIKEIKEEPVNEIPAAVKEAEPQEEPVKAEPESKKNPFGIIAGLLSAGIVGVIIAIIFVIMKYYV
ncbi:MAG: hypothetical protein IJL97_05085, partial [Lachnospiraceae bacterium]|nr:hypothetical protein [Lachnospiraceae bacterium]